MKNNKETFKILRTNIGTEIKAKIIGGRIKKDSSMYERVQDVTGLWCITKFSESYINGKRLSEKYTA